MSRRWIVGGLGMVCASAALAQGASPVQVNFGGGDEASYLRLILLFASASLAPALLAVVTSFARIAIVLFFLRAGLGSQQLIPNPVLLGLALLLTAFSMSGVLQQVHERALQPLMTGRVELAEAWQAAQPPTRAFLAAHARSEDLQLLGSFSPLAPGQAVPLQTVAAAYALSELRAAFIIGFVIYLPFVVIDLVVAGTLASLGLVTLPQSVLALPFKVLLFVMVDGWRLLAYALLSSLQ